MIFNKNKITQIEGNVRIRSQCCFSWSGVQAICHTAVVDGPKANNNPKQTENCRSRHTLVFRQRKAYTSQDFLSTKGVGACSWQMMGIGGRQLM